MLGVFGNFIFSGDHMSGWKDIVRNVAPALGTALGGPMAGVATRYIADAWLGDKDASEVDIAMALENATPERLIELKRLDSEFRLEMKKLEVDIFKLEVSDKADARKILGINIWPQIILSGLFIGGYFVVLALLVAGEVTLHEAVRDMTLLLVGLITREVPTIMQFWFGSSYGSKEKDSVLSKSKS